MWMASLLCFFNAWTSRMVRCVKRRFNFRENLWPLWNVWIGLLSLSSSIMTADYTLIDSKECRRKKRKRKTKNKISILHTSAEDPEKVNNSMRLSYLDRYFCYQIEIKIGRKLNIIYTRSHNRLNREENKNSREHREISGAQKTERKK